MPAHEFEDGTIVSEMVIDIELARKKGRVSREEALDLARVANNIRRQRDAYKALFLAAENYIDKCPCDPDITTEQIEAWQQYQEALRKKKRCLS